MPSFPHPPQKDIVMTVNEIGLNPRFYVENERKQPPKKQKESERRVVVVQKRTVEESMKEHSQSNYREGQRIWSRGDEQRGVKRKIDERDEPSFHQRDYKRVNSSESCKPSYKKPRVDRTESTFNPKSFTLPMSGVMYLNYIREGIKTHEGRVCRGACQSMRKGDQLTLRDNRAGKGILCEITSCTRYSSFRDMLVANGVLKMLPQLTEFAKTASPEALLREGVRVYEGFPGSESVKTLGAVAIGVKFIKNC